MAEKRLPYLLVTRGIPGSGKSTWARTAADNAPVGQVKTVCMDELRSMLDRNPGAKPGITRDDENLVQAVQDHIVTVAADSGRDIIVHNTHTRAKIPNRLRRLTAGMAIPLLVDFASEDPAVCKQRDQERERTVGADVIDRMTKGLRDGRQGFKGWVTVSPDQAVKLLTEGHPVPAVDLPSAGWRDWQNRQNRDDSPRKPAVIVDLDGTLADPNGRDPYDASRCEEDLFNEHVWTAAAAIHGPWNVVFCSGRDSKHRPETVRWLAQHIPTQTQDQLSERLFMRTEGDSRPDSVVKRELFEQHIAPNYDVKLTIDDRDSIVRTWRALGLPCWQVAPGNF